MTQTKHSQIQNPQEFVTAFKQQVGPKFLIDVREPDETAQGILSGAQLLPSSEINNRLSEIPKTGALYLYCRSGARANRVAQYLCENGWNDIRVATGFGYADLKDVY
jgi:rhodanese-related sulfurtransferase